jgi:hypothetical protein
LDFWLGCFSLGFGFGLLVWEAFGRKKIAEGKKIVKRERLKSNQVCTENFNIGPRKAKLKKELYA